VLLVDGKELPGRLLPKEEARRIYEEIVRTRRDPALLEYMGQASIARASSRSRPGRIARSRCATRRSASADRDVVEFSYPFSTQKFTAKPIQKLSLSLRIESRDSIKSLYSPTYDASITRYGDHEARISFEQRDTVPTADFRLICTLAEGSIGASVLSYRPSASDDGYFLLLASPDVKAADVKSQPKTVIFVIDRSGSMAGKKIEQARNALKFVLRNLRDDDTFNIVAYDDRVETFRPELQPPPRYSTAPLGRGGAFCREHPRRRQHQYRRRLEVRPRHDPRRLPTELRPVPHRRPPHRGRGQGDRDRRQLPDEQSEPRAALRLRRRLRRQRPLLDRLSGGIAAPASTSSPTTTSRATSPGFMAR